MSDQNVKVSFTDLTPREIRLDFMEEILEFLASEAGKERPRMYAKIHQLRQALVQRFGCKS